MPNKQSALKELRKSKKRATHNRRILTNVKHIYKECLELVKDNKLEEAKKLAIKFQQAADKAAKRHVISTNKSRRKKSRLMAIIKEAGSPTKKES